MARFLSLLSCILITIASSVDLPMQQPITENSDPASFGYIKDIGPISWYGMDPKNSLCATGNNQSPINIEIGNTSFARFPFRLQIPFIKSADIVNLGHTVEVKLEDKGGTLIYPFPRGIEYKLQQLHFHTPSEHHFDGAHHELEMHIVFKADKGDIAVISQTYRVSTGSSSSLLIAIIDHDGDVRKPGSKSKTDSINFGPMIDYWRGQRFWTYSGSLTTPPCSEGVTWLISEYVQDVYVDTYLKLKNIMGFNARILQNEVGKENLLMGAGKALRSNGKLGGCV